MPRSAAVAPAGALRLLTVRQVAEWLGVRDQRVRDLAARRALPFYRVAGGKLMRFAERDVLAYLERVRMEARG